MLTTRTFPRLLRTSQGAVATATATLPMRSFSSVAKKDDDDAVTVSPVTEARKNMNKHDSRMVWGRTDESLPAPVLPDNPAELAALDPSDQRFRVRPDGQDRHVVIRQQAASVKQSPMEVEKYWKIYMYEDGSITDKWVNPLMGWTANADPYQFGIPLVFNNAQEAVYFAKKRGWKFVVHEPILRYARDDDAQYQDNFLSQAIAQEVQTKGTACKEWERKSAGTSHYFRPLKYHGDGLVPQHGPNGTAETAPHVEGYYKRR